MSSRKKPYLEVFRRVHGALDKYVLGSPVYVNNLIRNKKFLGPYEGQGFTEKIGDNGYEVVL